MAEMILIDEVVYTDVYDTSLNTQDMLETLVNAVSDDTTESAEMNDWEMNFVDEIYRDVIMQDRCKMYKGAADKVKQIFIDRYIDKKKPR